MNEKQKQVPMPIKMERRVEETQTEGANKKAENESQGKSFEG